MTCAECEFLTREKAGKGKAYYRCTHPGAWQGRVVACVPDWCTAAQIWAAPAWCGREKGEDNGKDTGQKNRVSHHG